MMAPLVGKAIRSRIARFWLATAGVATSTLLVLVLAGAYRGVAASVAEYAGQAGIDLWMAPPGTDNLIRSSSLFSAALADSVREVPGVADAAPLVRAFVTVTGERGSPRRLSLLGIGYRAPDGLGGPPRFVAGRPPAGRREVALDRAAAHRLGVGLSDTVWINGRAATVVGLTGGTNLLATQFVFGDVATAGPASGVAGRASFVAVRLASSAVAPVTARALAERFPDTDVFTRERFVANNQREVAAGFAPLLALVSILGVSAAAVLVALLVHGVVEDRRTDLAVLMALGVETGAIARAVTRHAARLIAAGSLSGVVLALGLGTVLDRLLPTVPLALTVRDVVAVLLLFAAFGLGAAAVPVLRLSRVDPLEAFRP